MCIPMPVVLLADYFMLASYVLRVMAEGLRESQKGSTRQDFCFGNSVGK